MDDHAEGNTVEIHGDEEIIEVIDLNDTEPEPGLCGRDFLLRSDCFVFVCDDVIVTIPHRGFG